MEAEEAILDDSPAAHLLEDFWSRMDHRVRTSEEEQHEADDHESHRELLARLEGIDVKVRRTAECLQTTPVHHFGGILYLQLGLARQVWLPAGTSCPTIVSAYHLLSTLSFNFL